MTLPLVTYRFITRVLAPALRWHVERRAKNGKEDFNRLNERYGLATAIPFSSSPIWIHAASVGEAQSALAVIKMIHVQHPSHPVLLTTGTVTSAKLMKERLPNGCVHQFAPLDHPDWVARFLDTWHPRAAIWLESELWPNMLLAIQTRHIPAILLNARMSPHSFNRWRLFPKTIATLLSSFTNLLAEGAQAAKHLRDLGALNVTDAGNLKFLAEPLSSVSEELYNLRETIKDRPVWLYASTHADEEVIAARIHRRLKRHFSNLLTIIVPRHPDRRNRIMTALAATDINVLLRSQHAKPQPQTDIYIADTLGELGLFYALCPVAVIGRSFSSDGGGGHNPIEAAQLGCYPISGPHVQNLQSIFDVMIKDKAIEILPTPETLATRLSELLATPETTAALGQAAKNSIQHHQTDTERMIRAALDGLLPIQKQQDVA
jgi:3-deoxy-D-manno-octulosonic-acid transferase